MRVAVLEPVSEENFDERRYLAANPEVAAAILQCPSFSALTHFQNYGKQEGRKQLTAHLSAMMRRKYTLFKPLLMLDSCRFISEIESFPMTSNGAHFTLADYQAESANTTPGYWVDELTGNPEGFYLDLGCGFRDFVFDNCLYLDVYPSATADIIISPNTNLPLKDSTLDGLCCLAVLEHVEDPFFVAAEIKRLVKPGGRIFIDWPFLQPVHGYPSHYYNATVMGLRRMFEDDFEIERIGAFEYQAADYTLWWILNWFIEGMEEGPTRNELMGMKVGDLAALKPYDPFYSACVQVMREDTKMKLACGNTLIGRRK